MALAIKAIVAAYEEIFSEFLAIPPGYESEREIKSNPRIQPSSVIDPNSYLEFIESQRKSRSAMEKENNPKQRSKERLLIGFKIK